jgi:hypothetical protein
MSKARQRQRAQARTAAARKAPRAQERARADQRPPTTVPRKAPRADKRAPVYRQRRFAKLPLLLKVGLAVFWLACLAATVFLVPTWTGRIGLMVVATMLLPLVVVISSDPTRRYR